MKIVGYLIRRSAIFVLILGVVFNLVYEFGFIPNGPLVKNPYVTIDAALLLPILVYYFGLYVGEDRNFINAVKQHKLAGFISIILVLACFLAFLVIG